MNVWNGNRKLQLKIKDISIRIWYMEKTIENGWPRDTLSLMIKSNAHERQGKAISNFSLTLADPQSDLAKQSLKDPYIFDFLTMTVPFNERELETELIKHLEKFLLELGAGFAFVGRQYHLEISDNDFYIDLLFYHLKLRCFVVIELKRGKTSDATVGQALRYIGWVRKNLAKPNQTVRGIIISREADEALEYAVESLKNVSVLSYRVDFKLLPFR